MKPPEFLPYARIKIEFGSREYWVDVNEYGDATIKCFEGRGELWRTRVFPGKTFRAALSTVATERLPSESWIDRLDAALADCRVLVGAGHVPLPYVVPCSCPATSEYGDPCPRHGIVGIGAIPR